MSRTAARETAMKLLYEAEFNSDPQDTLSMLAPLDLSEKDKEFMAQLRAGVAQNLPAIDELIRRYSRDWVLERIAKVDLSILRIALYELMYTSVPASVAVNEAVDMAALYCSDGSAVFINGILGQIVRDGAAGRKA